MDYRVLEFMWNYYITHNLGSVLPCVGVSVVRVRCELRCLPGSVREEERPVALSMGRRGGDTPVTCHPLQPSPSLRPAFFLTDKRF